MRLRLLSRSSALATLQTDFVERALRSRWPSLAIDRATRSSEGDRDRRLDLWATGTKGVFTADLSAALLAGDAEAVVHSWKDLPIDDRAETLVAATLERADPRDVLLVRREAAEARPETLRVLSSSPRRVAEITASGHGLLPWTMSAWESVPVRGNIATRLRKLVNGDGDALVMAKAALDRLLSAEAPAGTAADVRRLVDRCRWMVLPLQDFPTAAAQGAIAVEVAAHRADVLDVMRAVNHEPTWRAVLRERETLRAFGGGCHDAVGVTVLVRDYGEVMSVRASVPDRPPAHSWTLTRPPAPLPPPTTMDRVWPQPSEREFTRRRPIDAAGSLPEGGVWVTRAEALPARWMPAADQPVWAAGRRTWERLAARGIWVNGCAEGLGDAERPGIDQMVGHPVPWRRLTHAEAGDPEALVTYTADVQFPADLEARTHFYWTSGSAFLRALALHPSIAGGWHASGPGRTARVIHDALASPARASIWLDYTQWLRHVTP
ncbi:MAG: hydroxymethylbilane synthase [Acidobacteria bacterium]|nr:hydroxymethylbilane synthase [Acidobacteriota bacterium]